MRTGPTLEKFQRTRGVLKLMAAVVHALWERQGPNLLILPGAIPLYLPAVLPQLTQYLDENWMPIIESDWLRRASRTTRIVGVQSEAGTGDDAVLAGQAAHRRAGRVVRRRDRCRLTE